MIIAPASNYETSLALIVGHAMILSRPIRIYSLLNSERLSVGANCEHTAFNRLILHLEDHLSPHWTGLPILRVVVIHVATRELSEVVASGIGKEVSAQRTIIIRREVPRPNQGDACLHPAGTLFIVPPACLLHRQLLMRKEVRRDHHHDSERLQHTQPYLFFGVQHT